MSAGMVAVCGKCNVAIESHPAAECPYEYAPIVLNDRRYGWRMIEKSGKKNGKEEDQTLRA